MANTKTAGEMAFDAKVKAVADRKPNAGIYLKNIALTVDGDLCIGMTHNKTNGHYSCSAVETDGVRVNDPRIWDLYGNSRDGLSDLRLDTLQVGIRTI